MARYSKTLLVEGTDDQHVILALCKRFEIAQNFEIVDSKGIDLLFEQLPVRLKDPTIDTLGIIVDADLDLSARWDKLKQMFHIHGINFPNDFPEQGLIVRSFDKLSIGIWIMPNNKLNGMLEDFITFLIPSDDCLLPIIQDNLNEIELKELNKYKPIHRSKAIVHSWLAVQEDPGTPLGLSITKRYLTTDEDTCLKLVDWLEALFRE